MSLVNEKQQLEIAQIFGQNVDPEGRFDSIVEMVAETRVVDPAGHDRYFDVLAGQKYMYVLDTNNQITERAITGDTSSELTFSELASDYKTVRYHQILNSDERTGIFTRIANDINKSLNMYESYLMFYLLNAACTSTGNSVTLASGETSFTYNHFIQMWKKIKGYGTDLVLFVGANVWEDIMTMDWDNNKYRDFVDIMTRVYNVKIVPLMIGEAANKFYYKDDTVSGSSSTLTDVLDENVAYLVATNSAVGKPLIFARRRLNDVLYLGGHILPTVDGTTDPQMPERIVLAQSAPMSNSGLTANELKVGLIGFENIATATKNIYPICKFTRS